MEENTFGAAVRSSATLPQISSDLQDDRSLLQRYVETGDRDAMGALLLRHADLAYRLALRFLKNAADAEDAVQSAFIEVLRHGAAYERASEAGVKAWIMGFVINTCQHKSREKLRRQRRERESSDRLDAVQMEPASSEIHNAVRSAIEKLPEHYRMPIWLHYFEGLTVGETAVALRQPPDTVRKQLNRGLDRLRLALAGLGIASLEFSLLDAGSQLAMPCVPKPVTAAVQSFVETGRWPHSSDAIARLAAKKTIAGGMKAAAGAVIAGGMLCVAAVCFGGNRTPPQTTMSGQPVSVQTPIVPSVEYEDDFAGPQLHQFWETATPSANIHTGPRADGMALVIDPSVGRGTEMISRRIALGNAPLEISAAGLLFEVATIDSQGSDEFYFEIQDAGGHALVRTMLLQGTSGTPPFFALPMQTRLANNLGLFVPLAQKYYVEPSGRITQRLPNGGLQELGTVRGGIQAVRLRFFAVRAANSKYCISASKMCVRHIHSVEVMQAGDLNAVRSSKE